MTTDSTAGYQPPGSFEPTGSTTETARAQATQVGQTAKEKGTEVAATAADEAKNVAGETKYQAKALLKETQTQLRDQAGSQKTKASQGLRGMSDELRSLADGKADGAPSGMLTDLARQASDKMADLAGWLDSKEPGDLVEEIRDLARRKPGSFLLGAAVAGGLAGRLTRGAVDAKRDEAGAATSYDTSGTGGTGGTPAYAGTAPRATTTGAPWADPTMPGTSADEVIVVDEAVVVETDPFGANPQRTGVGGGRL